MMQFCNDWCGANESKVKLRRFVIFWFYIIPSNGPNGLLCYELQITNRNKTLEDTLLGFQKLFLFWDQISS